MVTIRRDVLIRSQITLATEPFSDTRHAKIHIPLLDQSSGRDGFECFMGCLALVLQIGLGQSSILLILRSKTVKPLDSPLLFKRLLQLPRNIHRWAWEDRKRVG